MLLPFAFDRPNQSKVMYYYCCSSRLQETSAQIKKTNRFCLFFAATLPRAQFLRPPCMAKVSPCFHGRALSFEPPQDAYLSEMGALQ